MIAGLLALALWACGGEPPTRDVSVEPSVDPDALGWISRVALDPEAFAALVEPDRVAWAALHAHRYHEAHASFREPAHRGRAAWHLAVLHDDLSRLTGHAHHRLYTEWEARGGLPEAARPVASLAARCTGVGDAERWLPAGEAVPAALDALELPADHPWSARAALHRGAETDPDALLRAGALHVEPADGFERRFQDPCVHATFARIWTQHAEEAPWAPSDDDLGGLLFAPWLTASALAHDRERGAVPGLTTPLALPALPGDDEVQPARDLATALDDALRDRSARLARTVGPDGLALLRDLALVEGHRQDVLVAHARDALLGGRPRQAATLLQLARSHDMGPGPLNPPELFVLLAEALLRTGREREALDALHPLLDPHPEVRALVEVLEDLTVLRGLERAGDAREP